MARNIEKYAAEGRAIVTKGSDQSLTWSEMDVLQNMATDIQDCDALWHTIITAFYFGAAVGKRKAMKI